MKTRIRISDNYISPDFPDTSENHVVTLQPASGGGEGGSGDINVGEWIDLVSEDALLISQIPSNGSITFNSFLVKKIDDCILIVISALFSISATGVANGWSAQYEVNDSIFDFGIALGGGVVMSTQSGHLLRFDYGDGNIGITYISGAATSGRLGAVLIFKAAVPYITKTNDDDDGDDGMIIGHL
jgi:hypothetical protein